MCQAAPVRVTRVEGDQAWIASGSGERRIALLGVDHVVAGDYVLVHASLALRRLDPEDAAALLAVFAEIEALGAPDEREAVGPHAETGE
ncbi:MAG: HypC/HybG/HupF family hydrogenase formation chaperone [Thermomicrobiales bacterium]|nr:HypC/HybG/HupF family hydrogenase formation chaperone [Thermomicrobiales bacterium]